MTRLALFSDAHGTSAATAAAVAATIRAADGLPDRYATDIETGGHHP